ncbi:MAG: retrotransposon gag domain-containing protein, partial [Candidatus Thiodiazotropha endolucinida]|nr:retrotransposon gag domain-containing protein [Candidatus Thiodiazotropha taylori]MCW4263277.1 retrotransposon gag domain-containing protein [Candidatus Thiodiazotropha endolucinida]
MSSEDSNGDATVVDSQDTGEPLATQAQTMTSNGWGVSAEQINPQLTAASTLLQLHNASFPNCPDDTENLPDNIRPTFGLSSTNGTGDGERFRAVPLDCQSYPSRNAAGQSGSVNMMHDPFFYSQPNIQNSISGLGNAISSLQQGQISIQQEHASIHTRQDSITGTLEQVLSTLQNLKDGHCTPQSHETNQNNKSEPPTNAIIVGQSGANSGSNTERYYGSLSYSNPRCRDPVVNGSIVGQSGAYSGSNFGRHSGSHLSNNPVGENSEPMAEYQAESTNSGSTIDRHRGSFPQHNSTDTISGSYTSQTGLSNVNRQSENQPWGTHPSHTYVSHSSSYYHHPAEADRNYEALRRDTTGYSTRNGLQRYSAQLNEAIQPRVGFYETPRRSTNNEGEETAAIETRPEARDSYYSNRSQRGYQGVTNRRQHSPENYGLKIPPFNGKEDWKIWINRFEAIADRRRWSEDAKLDNLLPKLQGKAGELVFSQLFKEVLGSYGELVKELNSRFRVVETEKSFAAKFSTRVQKTGETAEEFAADLKRLYAKAYKNRDNRTKREDLVRRFLDGMKDNEARFEIEFHKEPDDIDEAVYHAVNFIQTRRRNSSENYGEKKLKRYTRRTSLEYDSQSEEETAYETEEEDDRALRDPIKNGKPQSKKT